MSELIVIKRPPAARELVKQLGERIAHRLQPLAREHEKRRARIVSNWNNQPIFKATVKVTKTNVTLTVVVSNARKRVSGSTLTVGQLWDMLDRTGMRPHVIRARNNGVLMFVWGGPGSYSAKTRGGSGRASGQLVAARVVRHPGVKPMHAAERINEQLAVRLKKYIGEALHD